MPGEWPQRCPRCRQMALRHDSMQARVACEACQWDDRLPSRRGRASDRVVEEAEACESSR